MDLTDIPGKFNIPFAEDADPSLIRTVPETPSGTPGAASLEEGFPPETATAPGAGGIPPSIQDFNGIYKQITQWNRWQAAGNPIQYDSAFATAISGYPKFAVLASTVTDGLLWVNMVDGNTTDPDGGGAADWRPLVMMPSGTVGAPGLAFIEEETSGIYRSGAGELAVAILGVQVAKLTATVAELQQSIKNPKGIYSAQGLTASTASGTFVDLFDPPQLGVYMINAARGTAHGGFCLAYVNGPPLAGAATQIIDQWGLDGNGGTDDVIFQVKPASRIIQAAQRSGAPSAIGWTYQLLIGFN